MPLVIVLLTVLPHLPLVYCTTGMENLKIALCYSKEVDAEKCEY